MLAFATPPLGTPLPSVLAAEPRPPGGDAPAMHPFVRSVMPALDHAFGVEHGSAFPEVIAGLVERLSAGPLVRDPRPAGAAARPAGSID